MIVGIPVLNKHEMTTECLGFLQDSVTSKDFKVVIIDNASNPVYGVSLGNDFPFEVSVLRNNSNLGFYYPLKQLYEQYDDAIIGIMHNDLFIWEYGWDERMTYFFEQDPLLGVIGVCGSDEIDVLGGRGGGTMCNFKGERGQLQEHTGQKVTDLRPALVLDSMFMGFRREVIPHLNINEMTPLAHFMDRIYPVRAREAGYRTAVLGIEVDHLGGTTLVAEPRFEQDCRAWLEQNSIPPGTNAGLTMYQYAEQLWLGEFRDQKGLIPARIDADHRIYRA